LSIMTVDQDDVIGELTELLQVVLVRVLAGDLVLESLGLLNLLLDGDNPAVALGGRGSLKLVSLALNLERECKGAFLGDVGSLSL
jgi:hypothetical protein